jgi:GNAT superfamily N-acetyltransferase
LLKNTPHIIRQAHVGAFQQLSELAIRSKAHWNYSAQFIQDWVDELTYTAEQILHPERWFFVMCSGSDIQAFYQLVKIKPEMLELDGLFVDPQLVGQGLGKTLIEHAVQLAINIGYSKIQIQSDPNATDFYIKMGCVQVGELESQSIAGRLLPLLHFELDVSNNPKARS